jgi:glutamate racemase
MEVTQRIAQPLSGLIESGDISSEKLRRECRQILRPLKNCSHILLACTHYPAITSVMKEFVSTQTEFVDPAYALVDRIGKWKIPAGGSDVFLTSGNSVNMKKAASNAFGVEIVRPTEISRLS